MLNVQEFRSFDAPALPPIDRGAVETSEPKWGRKELGVSYSLSGHPKKYCLPSPSALRPYQDTKSGDLDTWPAHASATPGSTGASVHLTKDKHLVVLDDKTARKTRPAAKPKFLQQLERFLEKELSALGATEVKPSELRLQAYREVFEYLIEDFKTYKPLLSCIKNEYEMLLAQQREEIRHLQPLQQLLVAVSEQSEQKLMEMRELEKKEMADLKAENRKLYERIDDLKSEQLSLEEQVTRLAEELKATYLVYRDECDARKLLISDVNELRYQQEEVMISKQTTDTSEKVKDDPVMLRIALKKLREDEAEATRRLNEMKANYGDVIPRRDYEHLQSQYQALDEKLETLKSDYLKLKAEHDALLDMHKQVVQQRDDYYVESETLKRSGTPRPNWSRCSEFISGGPDRWRILSEGKTSDEIVEVLLNEIRGIGLGDDVEYFDGLGFGPEVPKFLQYEGKVKNRRWHQRDCFVLIYDIWKERQLQLSEQTPDGAGISMADFIDGYLRQRFNLPKMAAEWAYNLRDVCQKFSNDLDIRMFWAIVTGEGDEQIYRNYLTVVAQLLSNLVKMDQARGNQATLSQEDFGAVLSDFFRSKTTENIARLVKAAATELDVEDGGPVFYKNLFVEDDEFKLRPFLEELRKQQFQDTMQYVSDIRVGLGDDQFVSVEELKQAILSTDPETDSAHLDAMLRWAYGVGDSGPLDPASTQPLNRILTRLQFGNIGRTGLKP